MVAKLLDDNKLIKSQVYLHYFKLNWSYSVSFNLANVGENLLWDRIYRYLCLEKESDNFRAVFTYCIKRARELKLGSFML